MASIPRGRELMMTRPVKVVVVTVPSREGVDGTDRIYSDLEKVVA